MQTLAKFCLSDKLVIFVSLLSLPLAHFLLPMVALTCWIGLTVRDRDLVIVVMIMDWCGMDTFPADTSVLISEIHYSLHSIHTIFCAQCHMLHRHGLDYGLHCKSDKNILCVSSCPGFVWVTVMNGDFHFQIHLFCSSILILSHAFVQKRLGLRVY